LGLLLELEVTLRRQKRFEARARTATRIASVSPAKACQPKACEAPIARGGF